MSNPIPRAGLLLALVIGGLLAGCVTPGATGTDPVSLPLVARAVTHAGCSLQIAFFTLPVESVRAKLPPGFEPVIQTEPAGGEGARTFVTGYGCEGARVDDVATAETAISEMGFAFAVEPPEALRRETGSHWVVAEWFTNDPVVAAAYALWGLGRAADVERATLGAAGAGIHRTGASLDGEVYGYQSRNTAGVVDLAEDTLRLFTHLEGRILHMIDLVVAPTQGGTGLAEYESTDDAFYPATSLRGQGFHEAWTGDAWTFTRMEMPGSH